MAKLPFILIISLAIAALIGTLGLQIYWVRASLQIAEKQFDKSVADALDIVSRRLETEDEAQGLKNLMAREGQSETLDYEMEIAYLEQLRVERIVQTPPVEERILPQNLDDFLKEEFKSRGITTPFTYGVFSNTHRAFVVKDNSFLVLDPAQPQGEQLMYRNIYQSPYFVHLFRTDLKSEGVLMIFFPEISQARWQKIWPALLPSLLFLLLLSACFAYTFWFVFRQKKLSEMKNDFINNMTHEFKTPIATISLATDAISAQLEMGKPEKVNRSLDIIRAENRRMNSQVEKVLQMAQLDKEELKLSLEIVDLHEIIESAVENFNLVVEKHGGQIEVFYNARHCTLLADKTHLSNVINNLLDNANKYSPESPIVEVRTIDTPKGICCSISDKGLGISKENQRYVFDKFFRVHTGNLHDVKGFGLGLSYVKDIVLAHKGVVHLESNPGLGSTFSLTLPVMHKSV